MHSRHRHRAGLCHDRRHRIRGALGLQRNRDRHQSGCAVVRRSRGRSDPDLTARIRRRGSVRGSGTPAGAEPERVPSSHRFLLYPWVEGDAVMKVLQAFDSADRCWIIPVHRADHPQPRYRNCSCSIPGCRLDDRRRRASHCSDIPPLRHRLRRRTTARDGTCAPAP